MKTTAKILIGIIAMVGSAESGYSLCLHGHPSVVEEYKSSVLIFIGEVISEEPTPEEADEYLDGTTYTVRIIELFRGGKQEHIRIFSENSSGRFPMEIGKQYILFISKSVGRHEVYNCGNSGLLAEKENVLTILRKLKVKDTR